MVMKVNLLLNSAGKCYFYMLKMQKKSPYRFAPSYVRYWFFILKSWQVWCCQFYLVANDKLLYTPYIPLTDIFTILDYVGKFAMA